jgi:general secretion pathway protein A
MYLDHFSLKIKPFQITVDPKFLWLGEKHKEALATLRYGILDNRGFLLMTGEVGTGKTILINRLISLLEMDTVVATLPDPDLESMDFYKLLAHGLKLKHTFETKGEFLIQLRDFLYQSYARQQQVLLIIDESQRLNSGLMEDIRVLSNFEMQDRKLINIFFVGQQEFNSILMTPQNRALSQRITVRYHIEALNEEEVGAYIRHRLKVAGTEKRIFDASAVSEIYKVSGGIPRLINIVSDHAMLTAYAQGSHSIDGKIVEECAEELRIPLPNSLMTPGSGRTLGDSTTAPGFITHSTIGIPATISTNTRHVSAERRQPQTRSSPLWHLAYAAVIIFLLGGIVLLVGKDTFLRNSELFGKAATPQSQASPSGTEKNRQSFPTALGDPPGDHRLSVPESGGKPGAADAASGKPLLGYQAAGPDRPQQERNGLDSSHGPAGNGTTDSQPLVADKVTIPFSINSNNIDEASYPLLDRIAEELAKHPEITVGVKGYTDNSGSPTYNESVSGFRANTVQSYLIGKGVDPKKITVFAMGNANPIASNGTTVGRKSNRRVEIEFYTHP